MLQARVNRPRIPYAEQVACLFGHIEFAQLLRRDHQQGLVANQIIAQREGYPITNLDKQREGQLQGEPEHRYHATQRDQLYAKR